MRELKVALITAEFPPQRTSAAVQVRDLAEEFVRLGHKPTVIVPSTDVSGSWDLDRIDEVDVLRIKARPVRDIGYFKRAINETLLPFLMISRLYKSPLWSSRWDIIAWYSPPIFFGPLILLLKRRTRAHTYLILRDIFPEWAIDLGIIRKGPVYWYFRAVARLQYAAADTIGVQTASNLPYLVNWTKKPGRILEVLHNWQHDRPPTKSSIDFDTTLLAGRKIFIYIGNMGIAQGTGILIDLAASLTDRHDIGFAFVGRGSEVDKLKAVVDERRLDNVLFFNEIPSEEIPALLAQCHVGLLALHPKHKSHNIPGKFLSYLLAGLPVLARVNEKTDLIELINGRGTGRAFTGDALAEMRRFAIEICDDETEREHISRRAKDLGIKMFSPSIAVNQIISHLSA